MKRELKFRAWCNTQKVMVYDNEDFSYDYWDGLSQSNVGMVNGLLAGEISEFHEYIWMLYTGLKDKNGKEIFEGDIVKHFGQHDNEGINSPHISIFEVQYLENMACFFPFNDLSWGSIDSEDYEIIGNIFENPELLEAVA